MAKVVLVTGASRGIGRAVARLAGAHGWSVGVNFTANAEAAAQTVAEVEAAGGQALAIRGDVSQEADVLAMFKATRDAFGPLNALVNNAGIVAPSAKLVDMDTPRLERVFAVNVLGSYLCAREAARCMSRSLGGAGGVIVNMSSVAARLGSPHEFVDYAGAKGAVDTMTLGLAKELGPDGVRVNAIRPGLIDTEIHAAAGYPERAAELGSGTPLGRAGTVEEVAEAVLWLMSDAASYVTGSILDVAGGR